MASLDNLDCTDLWSFTDSWIMDVPSPTKALENTIINKDTATSTTRLPAPNAIKPSNETLDHLPYCMDSRAFDDSWIKDMQSPTIALHNSLSSKDTTAVVATSAPLNTIKAPTETLPRPAPKSKKIKAPCASHKIRKPKSVAFRKVEIVNVERVDFSYMVQKLTGRQFAESQVRRMENIDGTEMPEILDSSKFLLENQQEAMGVGGGYVEFGSEMSFPTVQSPFPSVVNSEYFPIVHDAEMPKNPAYHTSTKFLNSLQAGEIGGGYAAAGGVEVGSQINFPAMQSSLPSVVNSGYVPFVHDTEMPKHPALGSSTNFLDSQQAGKTGGGYAAPGRVEIGSEMSLPAMQSYFPNLVNSDYFPIMHNAEMSKAPRLDSSAFLADNQQAGEVGGGFAPAGGVEFGSEMSFPAMQSSFPNVMNSEYFPIMHGAEMPQTQMLDTSTFLADDQQRGVGDGGVYAAAGEVGFGSGMRFPTMQSTLPVNNGYYPF